MTQKDAILSEIYDIKGYPIRAGDLVRSYHYTGARGKIHYLYHVISLQEHGLKMLPAEWADPNYRHDGGACYFDQAFVDAYSITIISGRGGKGQSFETRGRKKK